MCPRLMRFHIRRSVEASQILTRSTGSCIVEETCLLFDYVPFNSTTIISVEGLMECLHSLPRKQA